MIDELFMRFLNAMYPDDLNPDVWEFNFHKYIINVEIPAIINRLDVIERMM